MRSNGLIQVNVSGPNETYYFEWNVSALDSKLYISLTFPNYESIGQKLENEAILIMINPSLIKSKDSPWLNLFNPYLQHDFSLYT